MPRSIVFVSPQALLTAGDYRLAIALILSLGLAMVMGCAQSQPAAPTAAPTGAPEPTAEPASQAAEDQPTAEPTVAPEQEPGPVWTADGVIGPEEYAHQQVIGQVTVWWRNDADYLYIAFEAATTSWVAVGLAPEQRMPGANYLLGAVENGQAQLWDAYGQAPVGATHPPDEDLGGSDDIVADAGVEEGGVTRFEAQIPLDSGDAYDKPLVPGETYPIVVAVGGSDGYNAPHTYRGGGQITLGPAS